MDQICSCCGAPAQVIDLSRSGAPARLCLDCYSAGCDGKTPCQR